MLFEKEVGIVPHCLVSTPRAYVYQEHAFDNHNIWYPPTLLGCFDNWWCNLPIPLFIKLGAVGFVPGCHQWWLSPSEAQYIVGTICCTENLLMQQRIHAFSIPLVEFFSPFQHLTLSSGVCVSL